MLHPTKKPKKSYLEKQFKGIKGPVIAASDYVRAVPEQIDPWVPGGLLALGTDGMGRSETRPALRRYFEVDAECIAIAALYQLHQRGDISAEIVEGAIGQLGVDPEKINPLFA